MCVTQPCAPVLAAKVYASMNVYVYVCVCVLKSKQMEPYHQDPIQESQPFSLN